MTFKNIRKFSDFAGLTLSWRRPLSYRNQSIDLQSKSMDWFLYDRGLRHESVKQTQNRRKNTCLHLSYVEDKLFPQFTNKIRGRSFSMCARFSEKLTFLTP